MEKTYRGGFVRAAARVAIRLSVAVLLVAGFGSAARAQETGSPITRPCNHLCNTKLRFATAASSLDYLVTHGRIVPLSAIDPANEMVSFGLANSGGYFVAVTLPAGSLVARPGGRWIYKDQQARFTGGIQSMKIGPRRDALGGYRVDVVYFGDMSAATEATMTMLVRIGDDLFTDTGTWTQTQHGWSYALLP